MSIPSTQILMSKTTLKKKKKMVGGNQGFLEKYLLLGLEQEICKMILKHPVVP